MAALKKFTQKGEHVGEVEVDSRLASAQANAQSIKDYLIAIRNNQRQWSASTKTRAEVKHTTAKCTRQKGTGNARHGSLVAPQFRGGGIVFGPRPKFDQHIRINRKEKKLAIRSLFGEKIREGKMHIIESLDMEAPKTKEIALFLKKASASKKVLFLGESHIAEVESEGKTMPFTVAQSKHRSFQKSVNNLPKASFALAKNVSGYDVVRAHEIFLTEQALEEIVEWLCQGGKS